MVSPYQIGAVQIAQTALRPAVVDFVELATSSENLELAMEEMQHRRRVRRSRAGRFSRPTSGSGSASSSSPSSGKGGHMEFNPAHDAVMRAGDELVVLGRPGS